MKTCPKCKEVKSFANFSLNKSKPDGLQAQCKTCCKKASSTMPKAGRLNHAAACKAWHEANKDRASAYAEANRERKAATSRAWYVANKERASANAKAWREANPERKAANDKACRIANPERYKANRTNRAKEDPERKAARKAKWEKENPERRRINEHNRNARKRDNGGKLSQGLTDKLFKLQRGKCACCGLPLGDGFHLDHIVPIKLGGPNADDNMQLLRKLCNQQKHAKHPVDFMQQRGFLL